MLFLIYINNIFDNLNSVFADDTTLLSVVRGINQPAITLKDDLEKNTHLGFLM